MIQVLAGGSENLFYLTYGMQQSRTSRRAEAPPTTPETVVNNAVCV
jgi:hypothetical protein